MTLIADDTVPFPADLLSTPTLDHWASCARLACALDGAHPTFVGELGVHPATGEPYIWTVVGAESIEVDEDDDCDPAKTLYFEDSLLHLTKTPESALFWACKYLLLQDTTNDVFAFVLHSQEVLLISVDAQSGAQYRSGERHVFRLLEGYHEALVITPRFLK